LAWARPLERHSSKRLATSHRSGGPQPLQDAVSDSPSEGECVVCAAERGHIIEEYGPRAHSLGEAAEIAEVIVAKSAFGAVVVGPPPLLTPYLANQ